MVGHSEGPPHSSLPLGWVEALLMTSTTKFRFSFCPGLLLSFLYIDTEVTLP